MILKADLRPGLVQVQVPTLILTPEDDRLLYMAEKAGNPNLAQVGLSQ